VYHSTTARANALAAGDRERETLQTPYVYGRASAVSSLDAELPPGIGDWRGKQQAIPIRDGFGGADGSRLRRLHQTRYQLASY
jgi:hypothetical protein